MKVFSEDNALQLAERLLQNDKDIKTELESKIPTNYLSSIPPEYVTESEMNEAIANAQLSGGNVDLSDYATEEYVNKNTLDYTNVISLGLDNTGLNDNAELLQNIIDTVPSGATLYFPYGEYLLSKGVVVNKNIQFIGDKKGRYLASNDDPKVFGSCLKFMDAVSNDTMIIQGSSCWSLSIENLILHGNSGVFYDDGLNDETIPYNQYRYEIINENVNGVLCVNHADINNCAFNGFSGNALVTRQAQNVSNCFFRDNGIGIYTSKNDAMIRDCYITAGKTGIYCPESKNIMIHDCYIELMTEYGIYCENTLNGFVSGYIDHINYSGIHAYQIQRLLCFANLYRTGMYYAGKPNDELYSSDASIELENFSKACGISAERINNSTLIINAMKRTVDDAETSKKYAPNYAVYTQQAFSTTVYGSSNDIYIKWYSDDRSHLMVVSENGVTEYTKNQIKYNPVISYGSKQPYSTLMANKIGDIYIDTSTGSKYEATYVDLDAKITTWEKQYTSTEIADIASKVENSGDSISDEIIASAVNDYMTENPVKSPTIDVNKVGGTTTLTITDAEGVKTATIKDGEDGSGATSESVNIFKDINWCAIGDSYTWGDPANEKFTDRNGTEYALTATRWLANEIEANLIQVGFGGAHLMPKIVDGEIDASVSNYVTNDNWWYGMKNITENTNIVTIQLGLNDNGGENYPIGTDSDDTVTTSWGAFKVLMDKINTTCPLAKVGIIVSDAWLDKKYAQFLYSVSAKYNLPILDLNTTSIGTIYGTDADNSYNYNFASSDVKTNNNSIYRISNTNGHPNTVSHKLRAQKLKVFLEYLMTTAYRK